MPNKMLIDASHPEETRVVVTRGNRIEEFDFESQDKKQLRGNIYLARVTRVEPSLQAAFVEYGGNRHGFLAFNEIHPDYYQIPVADRQALLRAEAEEADRDDDDDHDSDENGERNGRNRRRRRGKNRGRDDEARAKGGDSAVDGDAEAGTGEDAQTIDGEVVAEVSAEAVESVTAPDEATDLEGDSSLKSIAAAIEGDVVSEAAPSADEDRGTVEEIESRNGDDNEVESIGADDALDEVRPRRKTSRKHYKIQEVIKRRQILLVQVVKEERGNKGAALTTYLSLAGRYSVLMPNTARGGGISRKITSAQDRKRLKDVMKELEVPQGMGVILRTAGENRTKAEIKRDYEYLMRLWENVRNLTLQSTAPALVYEEGSLIKRSVRDLYNKDIEEILVSGEEGYREAKDFMRMLMPSHAKMVQPYRSSTPILAHNGIEAQLDRMLQPQVTLKSGGYIIINQTEALVSIDVNSGRSTREHSIEDTALKTNLEAADEIARQLRLRDLAGLIVIDFIDMEEGRNNRAVEKKMKDCLKNDRARIQVGRISHFGLLEMSRQRIRAGVLESTMKPCPHCGGAGHVRSDSSVGLMVIRAIEDHLLRDPRHHVIVKTPAATALYVLNHKRSTLVELEKRFGLTITLEADESVGSQQHLILRGAVVENPIERVELPPPPVEEEDEEDIVDIVEESDDEEAGAQPEDKASGSDDNGNRKKRRRRRRRGGRDREQSDSVASDSLSDDAEDESGEAVEADADEAEAVEAEVVASEAAADDESDKKKRRRGKRGGRRSREAGDADAQEDGDEKSAEADGAQDAVVTEVAEAASTVEAETPVEPESEEAAPAKPARKPRKSAKAKATEAKAEKAKAAKTAEPVAVAAEEAAPEAAQTEQPAAAPAEDAPAPRASRRKAASETPAEPKLSSTAEPAADAAPKKGWWQRKSFF